MSRKATFFAAILALSQFASNAQASLIYLALGDSSAFGETNRTHNPSNGDRGYVKPFADYLATRYGQRPDVLNLAINGETTGSFFTGTGRVSSDGQGFNTNYIGRPDPFAQYQEYVDRTTALTAGGANRITDITVQFGANNLDGAASNPVFLTLTPAQQQALILSILQDVQNDYIAILGDVRNRFPDANIYAIGYHNPYNGAPDHPLYSIADPAVRGLNSVIAGVAPIFGAHYVDFYSAIHPNEASLTLINTYMTDPVNYVHLNDEGYKVASHQLILTASAPAPSSAVLAAVGFYGFFVIGHVKRLRKVAA